MKQIKETDIIYPKEFVKVRLGMTGQESHVYIEHNGDKIGIPCNEINIRTQPGSYTTADIEVTVDKVDGEILLDGLNIKSLTDIKKEK